MISNDILSTQCKENVVDTWHIEADTKWPPLARQDKSISLDEIYEFW